MLPETAPTVRESVREVRRRGTGIGVEVTVDQPAVHVMDSQKRKRVVYAGLAQTGEVS
jgi:hypothetical protein